MLAPMSFLFSISFCRFSDSDAFQKGKQLNAEKGIQVGINQSRQMRFYNEKQRRLKVEVKTSVYVKGVGAKVNE